jgi:hypothetical protein
MAPSVFHAPVMDGARAFGVQKRQALRPVMNAALGGEVNLSNSFALGAGLFTDLSAVSDADALRYSIEKLSRVGASAGLGWLGERTTTWFSLVFIGGTGAVIGSSFEGQRLTYLESKSVLFMMGSSTDL